MDIITYSILNGKIKAIESNGAVTIGDGTLTDKMHADNSISSMKLKGNIGRIFQKNAITVTLGSTITVKKNINFSIYYDDISFSDSSSTTITITNAITGMYCLYFNLKTNKLEIAKFLDINVPCVRLAVLYNSISTQPANAILYGNDESIIVSANGLRIQDKTLDYKNGVVSYTRKINILFSNDTLDIEFLSGSNTAIFVNGKRYSNVSSKEIFNCTEYGEPFNLLYDITKNKLFFTYGNKEIALFSSDNNKIVLICSFFTSGAIVDIAQGSIHNVLINGVDYFPESIERTTVINSNDTMWSDSNNVFGMNKQVANVPQKLIGTILVNGMVSAVCGKNNRWNQKPVGSEWVNAYDSGNGGHVFEGFSKDKSYRYTVLLDHRQADKLPIVAVQNFAKGNPGKTAFGWMLIGTDDSAKTSYGFVGGWQFRDNFAKANCPLLFEKRPLPTELPSNTGSVIPLDSRPILACDPAGKMRLWNGTSWDYVLSSSEVDKVATLEARIAELEAKMK